MAILPIRRFPDPILKHPAHPVVRVDAAVSRLVDSLIETMRHHPRCVGLAAPQVGSRLRLAVMDASSHPNCTASHGLLILINPRIDAAEGVLVQREGCLSIPDFTGNVRRACRVRLQALDRFGVSRAWWLEGFEAIVAQHELDHLRGTLFLDRVVNLKTDVFKRKTYG
ncbi:MAG: peptide deformylase [Candidatus Omnitrophica bacterium]|nr:peptide deformylase [Candidatus Omnitrophota bacterium]